MRKFEGLSISPDLKISETILLDHSSGGLPDFKSLENSVARMRWVEGSFFRKPYKIPSGPGAEVDDFLFKIALMS